MVGQVSELKVDENTGKDNSEEEENIADKTEEPVGEGVDEKVRDNVFDEFNMENININARNDEDTNDSETNVISDDDLLIDKNNNGQTSSMKMKLKKNTNKKSEPLFEEKFEKDDVMRYAMTSLQKLVQQQCSDPPQNNKDTANEKKLKNSVAKAEGKSDDDSSLDHFLGLYTAPEILSDVYLCPNCNTNNTKSVYCFFSGF